MSKRNERQNLTDTGAIIIKLQLDRQKKKRVREMKREKGERETAKEKGEGRDRESHHV